MSSTPLTHPAAWRGEELLARQDWLHELTPEEIEELRDFAVDEEAPLSRWSTRLRDIRDSLEHGSGAAMVRGFPVREFSEGKAREIFLRLCREIGTPVSQSAAGEIVFSVRNAGFKADDPRSRGPNTAKKLSFHTDRCDVIAFLCWRQAKTGGDNELVSSMTVYNEIARLRPVLLKVLEAPFVYQRHTVDGGNERASCSQPIFSFCEGHFAASFLRVLIDRADADPNLPDLTPIQREALDYLEAVAGDPALHVRFWQEPGDILFLNNWVTLHRRTEFEDYDQPEEKRCLFRVWLSVPNSRPLDPQFAENFGATEAGAIRGGMRATSPPA